MRVPRYTSDVPGSSTFLQVKSQICMTSWALSCGTQARLPRTSPSTGNAKSAGRELRDLVYLSRCVIGTRHERGAHYRLPGVSVGSFDESELPGKDHSGHCL